MPELFKNPVYTSLFIIKKRQEAAEEMINTVREDADIERYSLVHSPLVFPEDVDAMVENYITEHEAKYLKELEEIEEQLERTSPELLLPNETEEYRSVLYNIYETEEQGEQFFPDDYHPCKGTIAILEFLIESGKEEESLSLNTLKILQYLSKEQMESLAESEACNDESTKTASLKDQAWVQLFIKEASQKTVNQFKQSSEYSQ